ANRSFGYAVHALTRAEVVAQSLTAFLGHSWRCGTDLTLRATFRTPQCQDCGTSKRAPAAGERSAKSQEWGGAKQVPFQCPLNMIVVESWGKEGGLYRLSKRAISQFIRTGCRRRLRLDLYRGVADRRRAGVPEKDSSRPGLTLLSQQGK